VPNKMETDFIGLRVMPFSQNQVRREFRHDSSAVGVKLHLRVSSSVRPSARSSVRPSVRSFVYLSVVSVTGVHPMGGINRSASI